MVQLSHSTYCWYLGVTTTTNHIIDIDNSKSSNITMSTKSQANKKAVTSPNNSREDNEGDVGALIYRESQL